MVLMSSKICKVIRIIIVLYKNASLANYFVFIRHGNFPNAGCMFKDFTVKLVSLVFLL